MVLSVRLIGFLLTIKDIANNCCNLSRASDFRGIGGGSGGVMVLGKLPVPGRPTIWTIIGQGLLRLQKVRVGVVWTFLLSTILSLLCLPLSGRRPDID